MLFFIFTCRNLTHSLENLKTEMSELTHAVEDRLISTARKSIDELQTELGRIHTPSVPVLQAEEKKAKAAAAADVEGAGCKL